MTHEHQQFVCAVGGGWARVFFTADHIGPSMLRMGNITMCKYYNANMICAVELRCFNNKLIVLYNISCSSSFSSGDCNRS